LVGTDGSLLLSDVPLYHPASEYAPAAAPNHEFYHHHHDQHCHHHHQQQEYGMMYPPMFLPATGTCSSSDDITDDVSAGLHYHDFEYGYY
jgi:hypothetical protein